MKPVMDALWRALLYCLHPRVILLSLLPLLLLGVLAAAAAYFGWEPALAAVRDWLDANAMWTTVVRWLEWLGFAGFKTVVAPLLVLAIAVPLLVMLCLLVVSVLMTPAIVRMVAARRFDLLKRERGANLALQALWGLGHAALALIVFAISLPLWLIPLVAFLLPPLVWGWLTYRVLSFDCLADHASSAERREVFKQHRLPLLSMGIVSGYLGMVPGVLGLSSVMAIALAPIFIPLALWLYTLVFAFSSAWFAHYCLKALEDLRTAKLPPAQTPPPEPPLIESATFAKPEFNMP